MEDIKAPRGTNLLCKGWQQEAALRMLMNNLDPDVAEDPSKLIVYGGRGKAARDWPSYFKIVSALKELEDDETLLVQSGKPVAIFKTFDTAPRVLIANSNLVGKWANWSEFNRLEALGLIMYGQMTAGSWIYIGTQGILQGTYETFASVAEKYFNGTLRGKLVVSAGLGGMGGAQPLATVFNEGVFIGVEVDPSRIEKRLKTGYLDCVEDDLDKALQRAESAINNKEALSIGLLGNAADIIPRLVGKGVVPDVLTDQTSAHDIDYGYIPLGYSVQEAGEFRQKDLKGYREAVLSSMLKHIKAMLKLKEMGAVVFDYGNNIRGQVAEHCSFKDAFKIPGFVSEFIRPLFCKGSGPFRFVALSGDSNDIYLADKVLLQLFSKKERLTRWINKAQKRVKFQGLPARICWLEYGERAKAGEAFNKLVRDGKVTAPIVIGRDHLDCGSVASPNRETENMKDTSDAVADWPILNAMLNTACGASWVSFHHGGGVGMGYSLHAGMVCLADGTEMAEKKLKRVLTADPGLGVVRHLDAGYELARKTAQERGIQFLNRE